MSAAAPNSPVHLEGDLIDRVCPVEPPAAGREEAELPHEAAAGEELMDLFG